MSGTLFVSCPRSDATDGIRYVTLNFRDRRGAALPPYRNRYTEIIVFMCEQKPHPVWFSCRRKSYSVYGSLCEHNLTSKEE